MYIPVLRTAQAELYALQRVSDLAAKKIKPYLVYKDTGERTSLDKFCKIIVERFSKMGAFLEFPDHPNNTYYRNVTLQKEKFLELKKDGCPITPVISGSEKIEQRKQVRMAVELLEKFGKIGIRVTPNSNLQRYIAFSLYNTIDDPKRLTIFFDLGRVRSKDDILEKVPSFFSLFKEANVVFTGTVWGENQNEFEKGEISKVDNHLFTAWGELNQTPLYSDSLTDNPNSYIPSSEEVPFMKIIPYFKWLALDGKDFLVIRASEDRSELAKTIANELVNSYPHYFHSSEECNGCHEIRNVANPYSDSKSSPMTRKRMSFVHHMEVITSLLS